MINLVITLLSAIIFAAIGRVLVNMVRSKVNLEFYRHQGATIHFDALMGFFGLFSKSHAENKFKSNLNYFMKLCLNGTDHGIVAVNQPLSSKCAVLVYDSDLVKETLLHEKLFIKKPFLDDVCKISGFFHQNGDEVMKRKAVFLKIFSFQGADELYVTISKLIIQYITEFNINNQISSDSFTKIDLNKFFKPLMSSISYYVITGEISTVIPDYIADMNRFLVEMYDAVYKQFEDPIFVLFPMVTEKLRLGVFFKTFDRNYPRQLDIATQMLNEREKTPANGNSVLDRVIQHNRACNAQDKLEEIISPAEFVGIYNVFFFAGTDTSMATSSAMICHMADKPDIQKCLISISEEVYGSTGQAPVESIDENERLEMFTKEVLRLFSPLQYQQERVATRDLKLGQYHIKAGDRVFVMYAALHRNPEVYSQPDTFQADRFSKENDKDRPKYQYIPFSIGQRVCLGRHLGTLMVKLLLTEFVRNYEIRKPDGQEYYSFAMLTAKIESPLVLVRSK